MDQSWLKIVFSSKKISSQKVLEPYVKYFSANEADYHRFLLPFQLFNGILAFFIPFAIFHWLVEDSLAMVKLTIWLQCIFAPFHLPGIFLYATYIKGETDTQLEIDHKGYFINYQRGDTQLLFHRDQIEKLEVFETLFLPYQLCYVHLNIAGGKSIYISNLIVEPFELMEFYEKQPVFYRKWFNAFPKLQEVKQSIT